MARQELTDEEIDYLMDLFQNHFLSARRKKGNGTFASSHEIMGALAEEMHEVMLALHGNKPHAMIQELLDVATVCVFGAACIQAGKVDW